MDDDGFQDFLEAVFMNENRCQDEGFAEGQSVGRIGGLKAGYQLGCEKGGEIGSETVRVLDVLPHALLPPQSCLIAPVSCHDRHKPKLPSKLGFYQGFVGTCRPLVEDLHKPRVQKTMESLLQLIEQFSLLDANTPSLQEQLDTIRAKFKQMTSLLGIQAHFDHPTKVTGTSF